MTSLDWLSFRPTLRGLRRAPTLTVFALLSLALGLGVTIAVASALRAALLRPLPYQDPGRLVTVYRTTPHFDTGPFSAPNLRDLASSSRQLTALAAATPTSVVVGLREEPQQVPAMRVTGNLFATLGVDAVRGRPLAAADDREDAEPVVVLSADWWRDRLGADPAVVGSTLSIDGRSHRVVGIVAEGFRVVHGSRVFTAPLWLPARFTAGELGARRSNFLPVFGRLAPGASVESAEQELLAIFAGIVDAHPELAGEGLRLRPLAAEGVRAVRTPLLLLAGASLLVLAIATTNVACLLLARSVERRREMAVRVALGGRGWACAQPVLAEALALALGGALLGLGLAGLAVHLLGRLAVERMPQLAGLAVDGWAVACGLAMALVTALLAAAWPVWRALREDPQAVLRGGTGGGVGRVHHRALGTLVVVEVAAAFTLLVAAGLVLRGFARLTAQDPGFDPAPVLTAEVSVSPQRYPNGEAARRFLDPALAAIEQVPGVAAAGAISILPYRNWGSNFNIRYEGQAADNPTELPIVEARAVSPGFFAVTGQHLLAGRRLDAGDDERDEAPFVAVVNQALVARDFPDGDAVGRRFHVGDQALATIVGVVSDIRNFGPQNEPRPEVYFPYRQRGGDAQFTLMVRSRHGAPGELAAAVTAAVRSVDPGAAVARVMTMQEVIDASVGQPRFLLALLAVFALTALALAAGGLYGVLRYAVSQQQRDLGVRVALGSTPRHTVGHVVGRGMRLFAVGVGCGLVAALAVSRLLTSQLFGTSPLDATSWLLAVLVLGVVALLASAEPGLRAARVDPQLALRAE